MSTFEERVDLRRQWREMVNATAESETLPNEHKHDVYLAHQIRSAIRTEGHLDRIATVLERIDPERLDHQLSRIARNLCQTG